MGGVVSALRLTAAHVPPFGAQTQVEHAAALLATLGLWVSNGRRHVRALGCWFGEELHCQLYRGVLLERTAMLERIIQGKEITGDTVKYGAINHEAKELLAKWQDPDRDTLQPYT